MGTALGVTALSFTPQPRRIFSTPSGLRKAGPVSASTRARNNTFKTRGFKGLNPTGTIRDVLLRFLELEAFREQVFGDAEPRGTPLLTSLTKQLRGALLRTCRGTRWRFFSCSSVSRRWPSKKGSVDEGRQLKAKNKQPPSVQVHPQVKAAVPAALLM